MSYWINHLMGNTEVDVPLDSLHSLYSELSQTDEEHTDVSLTHESEWCLSAFPSGLLVCENVAGDGEPKHMRNVPKEKVIELWTLLSKGAISQVDEENWLSGSRIHHPCGVGVFHVFVQVSFDLRYLAVDAG